MTAYMQYIISIVLCHIHHERVNIDILSYTITIIINNVYIISYGNA